MLNANLFLRFGMSLSSWERAATAGNTAARTFAKDSGRHIVAGLKVGIEAESSVSVPKTKENAVTRPFLTIRQQAAAIPAHFCLQPNCRICRTQLWWKK